MKINQEEITALHRLLDSMIEEGETWGIIRTLSNFPEGKQRSIEITLNVEESYVN